MKTQVGKLMLQYTNNIDEYIFYMSLHNEGLWAASFSGICSCSCQGVGMRSLTSLLTHTMLQFCKWKRCNLNCIWNTEFLHSDTCLELLREDITVERTEVENKSTSSAATGIVTCLSKSHLKSQDSTSEETVWELYGTILCFTLLKKKKKSSNDTATFQLFTETEIDCITWLL